MKATARKIVGKSNKKIGQMVDAIFNNCENDFKNSIKGFETSFLSSVAVSCLDKSKALEKSNGLLMPDGTRFCYSEKGLQVFVIEQKPQVRTLFFENGSEYLVPKSTMQLALPYVVFIASVSNESSDADRSGLTLQVAFRNAPLTSIKDKIYQTCFANVGDYDSRHHEGLLVCLGGKPSNWLDPVRKTDEPYIKINKMLKRFWESKFQGYRTLGISSMSDWASKDIGSILKVNWPTVATNRYDGWRYTRSELTLDKVVEQEILNFSPELQSKTQFALNDIFQKSWKEVFQNRRNDKSCDTLKEEISKTMEDKFASFLKALKQAAGPKLKKQIDAAISQAVENVV